MIRKADLRDIPFITKIYNDAVLNTTATFDLETRSVDEMEQWFLSHKGKHSILVYEEGKRTIAYASLSTYRERAAFDKSVELSVYVDPVYQNHGIGSMLMGAIIDIARKNKEIHTIISLITYDNEASIQLHQTFGFQYCGRIEDAGFKFGRYLHLDAYQLIL